MTPETSNHQSLSFLGGNLSFTRSYVTGGQVTMFNFQIFFGYIPSPANEIHAFSLDGVLGLGGVNGILAGQMLCI